MKISASFILCFCIVISLLCGSISAAEKEVDLTYLDQQGDLTVMFVYDQETVDITFISPTGERLGAGNSRVEMKEGELWRTYRIKNAEEGQWNIAYDLGKNNSIECSVLEDNTGLWLQELSVRNKNNALEVTFLATSEEEVGYDYTLSAVDAADPSQAVILETGYAESNESHTCEVGPENLSSGDYNIRVDITADMKGTEVFDSRTSETVNYVNPNTPAEISDYRVFIDLGNSLCTINWADFTDYDQEGYRVAVYEEKEEPIYSETLTSGTNCTSAVFPRDTKNLTISLEWYDGSIWSKPNMKTVDLAGGETLSLRTEEVTGGSQAVIDYSVKQDRMVRYFLDDGSENVQEVSGEGYFSLPLHDDVNRIYASMEVDNGICFEVKASIFSDVYPPEIRLYEDLDGKTFTADHFQIIGQAVGSTKLTVGGEEAELKEDGSFSHSVQLTEGENNVEIRAADANGNESMMVLRVNYRPQNISVLTPEGTPAWAAYLPLIAALFASAVIAVAAAAFLRKTSAKKGRIKGFVITDVIVGIAEILIVTIYFLHLRFSNSVAFLDLMEASRQNAVNFLHTQRAFGIASLVGAGVVLVAVLATVLKAIWNKKKYGR